MDLVFRVDLTIYLNEDPPLFIPSPQLCGGSFGLEKMAIPKKESGYTSIANEILEAFARVYIPSYERRIVDVILRKTSGFIDSNGNRKIWDRIAYSQFEKFTRIRRQHIHRSILKLLEKKVIERRPLSKRGDYEYRIQKNYYRWIGWSPMQVTKDNKIVTHRGYTKKPIQVTKLSPTQVITKETKNYIKRSSNRTEESKFEFSEEAERLAHLFLQRSGVNILEFKKEHILKSWIDSIVKLHRIDGEEYSKIEEVILWVTSDAFWRTVCLSPIKFRKNDKNGTRYYDIFAYKMDPPKSKEPIRPSEVVV